MTYTVRLANPERFYFDHKARLFLDYYSPQGSTNILSEDLKKAVAFRTLIDVNGEVIKVLEAEKAALENATQEPVEVTPEVKVQEAPKQVEEPVKEEVEPTKEEAASDNEEEEAKVEPQKKAPAKRASKKTTAQK